MKIEILIILVNVKMDFSMMDLNFANLVMFNVKPVKILQLLVKFVLMKIEILMINVNVKMVTYI